MLIIKLMGGLGNQMFQYAFYLKMQQLGKQVKIDISGFENEKSGEKRRIGLYEFQNVNLETCTLKERSKFVDDNTSFVSRILRKLRGTNNKIWREIIPYDEAIFDVDNYYMLGYWNCEKYYENMMPELRNVFQFPEKSGEKNEKIIKEMEETNSVSLHIRRGDYLEPKHAQRFGCICTEEYYEKAIGYIKEHVNNPQFYIFSDEKNYIKQKYNGKEYHIIDWNTEESNAIFDLMLMSKCKHNICANSTFSKWAAMLNDNPDKIRINPMKQTADDIIQWEDRKRLWKNWIFIDEQFEIYKS